MSIIKIKEYLKSAAKKRVFEIIYDFNLKFNECLKIIITKYKNI